MSPGVYRPPWPDQVRSAFAYLVTEHGFAGPELERGPFGDAVVYHRHTLHIEISLWAWKNESGFTTTVRGIDPDGSMASASLPELYRACGLGPERHVAEGAGPGHTIDKRIDQHAAALRMVLPHLDGPTGLELLRRPHRRGTL